MRRLDQGKARLLTELISPHYPYQSIMLITDGRYDLHRVLYDFTRKKGFEFDLRTIGCDIDDIDADAHGECRIEAMDLRMPRYNRHAKQYENIYLSLHEAYLADDPLTILKKLYAIIKNAGILTLLLEKEAALLSRLDALLEESNFVAVGHVDIFDDFEVVTAKKLHGWGS